MKLWYMKHSIQKFFFKIFCLEKKEKVCKFVKKKERDNL